MISQSFGPVGDSSAEWLVWNLTAFILFLKDFYIEHSLLCVRQRIWQFLLPIHHDVSSDRATVDAPQGRCAHSTQVDAPHPPCHSAQNALSMHPKANTTAPHMIALHSRDSHNVKVLGFEKVKYHNHFVSYVYLFVYSHYFQIQTILYAIRFIRNRSIQLFVSHIIIDKLRILSVKLTVS